MNEIFNEIRRELESAEKHFSAGTEINMKHKVERDLMYSFVRVAACSALSW